MKVKANKSTNKCNYYCDRCKKQISFEEKTLYKVHIEYQLGRTKKMWDLCDRCYRALYKGMNKYKEGKHEESKK